jgi:hypothetical protein
MLRRNRSDRKRKEGARRSFEEDVAAAAVDVVAYRERIASFGAAVDLKEGEGHHCRRRRFWSSFQEMRGQKTLGGARSIFVLTPTASSARGLDLELELELIVPPWVRYQGPELESTYPRTNTKTNHLDLQSVSPPRTGRDSNLRP